ncbi:MAG: BACON domain-containing carbohydrate-binding protein [Bacteroidales bacterium]
MKKLYILLLFACVCQIADAQVYIEREVVSSGGDNFISGQLILTSTIGEIATETLGNMQFHMTQGFQQSDGLVVPSNRYVSYEEGVTSFIVFAPDNVNWVASCAEDWCELSYSGTGIGTITATYTNNELFIPRIANILVDIENIGTVIVTVHQAGFPIIIEADPNIQNVSYESGFTTFSITSNSSWIVIEDIDWLSIDPMTGDSIQELTVTYDANYSAYERTGEFIIIADSLDYFIVLSVVQEGATPYLTMNTYSINVGSGSGSTAFLIESNVNWMIDADETWFDVDPESGENTREIVIDYQENIGIVPRSGIVSIYSDIEDIGATFVINQDGALVYIIADPEFAEVNADSGTVTVTVTSNTEWFVNEHSDWLSIDPISANGDEILTITYESNPYTVTRSGKVFLETLGGTVTTSITIIQTGAEPTLVVAPLVQNVGYESDSTSFNVSSNTGWNVFTSVDWLNFDQSGGYSNGEFTVFYDENLLAAPRSATLTIITTDEPLELEVVLYQSGAPPTISVSPSFQEVGFEAGTCSLTVSSNAHWAASTNVPWLTLSPDSGELDGTITVSFAENQLALSRQGVITFTTSDGLTKDSVTIKQSPAPAFISVIPELHEVTSETGIAEIEVISNAFWEITFFDDWLEATPLAGFGNSTLTITYESNPYTVIRSGKVLLETLGGTVTTSITIIQTGAEPTLVVAPLVQNVGYEPDSTSFSVNSNTGWSVFTTADWLNFDQSGGYSDGKFTVFYDENLLAAPRSATITISTTDETLELEVVLYQSGAPPTISVSPSFQEVVFEAGTCTLTVSSNAQWTASTDVPWLTLSPDSGELNGTITVFFVENPLALSRQGVITFTASDGITEVSVIIEQAAAPAFLSVIPEFLEVTSETGIVEIEVTSNANWEITFIDDWLEATPLVGFGTETLTITYDSNPFTITRSGEVLLETLGGTVTTSITIIQTGAEPTLVVAPLVQNVGYESDSTSFSVTSNTGWSVFTTADWLNIEPSGGYLDDDFTVFYDENLLAAPRSATITISTTDETLESVVVLNQSGASPTISVSPSFQEVGFEAGTCTLTVSSNAKWTATTDVPWLTLSPDSGELDGTITVSFAENPLALSRQGVITFTDSDGITEISVIIEQAAARAFLSVMPLEFFVDPEAGTTYFTIISNATWEISNSEIWLHVIPDSGIGNATITLNYDANSELPRQGLIYVNVSGLPTEVVTINQATPFILILEPDSLTVGPSSGMAYLSVISNTNWTAESNVPWLQASPANGSDNDTITLTFNANTTDSVRIAEISVHSTGLPVKKSYLIQLPGQGIERVILPELIAGTNAIIEIPVMVSDLTGYGIITNEFVFSYDASVLIPSPPYVTTIGTMLGDAGWTLIIDQQEAGNLSVVALGSEPLSGSGVLTKLRFKVVGEQGSSSDLSFDEFVFNDNNPLVEITNGLLNIPIRNCGDVDENGFVQAYDASLALKHSIGLITLPPIGAYNADVNEDNLVRAFDAALILRAAINLPMPPGVSTCFNYDNITVGTLEYDFQFNAVLRNYEKQHDFINAEILFTGITRPEKVFSISFDVTSPVSYLNSVEFIDLPPGYSVFTNKISERIIRIAIIHPMGILSQDLNLRVLTGHCGTVSLALKNVVINDHEFPDILISNPFSSSLCKGEVMLTAYPNPFRTSTTIAYEVIEKGNIEIEIIDLFGRSVDVLYRGMQDEGFYKLTWDGKSKESGSLPQGWYMVRMKTENYIQQVRISLIR